MKRPATNPSASLARLRLAESVKTRESNEAAMQEMGPLRLLTPTQTVVVRELAKSPPGPFGSGASYKALGKKLRMSDATARSHVNDVFELLTTIAGMAAKVRVYQWGRSAAGQLYLAKPNVQRRAALRDRRKKISTGVDDRAPQTGEHGTMDISFPHPAPTSGDDTREVA